MGKTVLATASFVIARGVSRRRQVDGALDGPALAFGFRALINELCDLMNRFLLLGLTFVFALSLPVGAQTTAFTYQGRLQSANGPATGLYDFNFLLHSTAGGGTPLTGPVVLSAVPVTNGVFSVVLDFGDRFPGADRWLEIAVRTNRGLAYTTLSPRQRLTSTPYAVRAGVATAALTATTAAGVAAGAVGNQGLAPGAVDSTTIRDGTIGLGDLSPAVLSNTFWRLGGNLGTTPNSQFLGTLDNQPVEFRVNNSRMVRLEPGAIGLFGRVNIDPPYTLNFGASTRQMLNLWNAEYGIGIQADTLYQRTAGEFAWHRQGVHHNDGANPGAGGVNLMRLDGSGNLIVNGGLVVDGPGLNRGTHFPGLVFGNGSGEAIASKRNQGGNQFGLDLYTAFVPRVSVSNGGQVGIGTQTPLDAILDVEGAVRLNDFDIFLRAGSDRNHGIGYRSDLPGRHIDGPFIYGFNGGALGTSGPELASLTWDYQGNVWVNKDLSVGTLTIRGGADVAEPFPMKEDGVEPGSVMVIDPSNPGHLTLSTQPYDTRVAGVVSGAGGVSPGLSLRQEGVLDEGRNIALSGRVYVKADANGAPIRPGDLLTTGTRPGHAARVTDPARGTGAILGKAMTNLEEGTGLVLVLVSLQ